MKKDRDAYIVLAPTGKSKIYSVAARRVGSKDRYTVVATCSSEAMVSRIVTGLHILQDEEVKLDTIAQRAFADVCERLTVERDKYHNLSRELRDAQNKVGEANIRIRELERKLVLAVPQPSMLATTVG